MLRLSCLESISDGNHGFCDRAQQANVCNAVDLLYNRIISRNRREGGSHSIYPGTYPIQVGQLSLGRHSRLAHIVSDHQCYFLFILYSILFHRVYNRSR